MAFPITKTNAIDGVTEIVADHLNNLEDKIGTNNETDATSLDYQLRNVSSVDPGHKHTAGAFTGGFDGDVIFRDPVDHLWKPVGPDSASLVARTGAQSIAGVKTFTQILVLPSADPTTANEATRKGYVDAQVALKVAKTGDTMSGALAMGGNNITGVGTLVAATAQLTNPLAVIYGGTGLAMVAAGDILYASAGDTLLALAKAAAGNVLLSGDAPSWGKVVLTTHISGILLVANGGTGADDGSLAAPGLQLPHIINKVASANLRNSHDAVATSVSAAYVKVKTITLTKGLVGQARFLFDIQTSDAAGPTTAYGRIYRNGVALGLEQTDVTGSYATKSEDLTQTWNPGDTCELWVKIAWGKTVSVRNFRIAYDDLPTVAVAAANS